MVVVKALSTEKQPGPEASQAGPQHRPRPGLGAGGRQSHSRGLRAEGHTTHLEEGRVEVEEGSPGGRWQVGTGSWEAEAAKVGLAQGCGHGRGAPFPFSCLSIVRWGKAGAQEGIQEVMGLGPQSRSCPRARNGRCRSRSGSEPSGHMPSCQGRACPLRAARTAGSPQAWASGSHPTPYPGTLLPHGYPDS